MAGLGAAGLVFGIIGTMGFLISSITCCIIWRRLRRDIRLLKCEVERGNRTTANPADPNLVPLVPATDDPTSSAATPLPITASPLQGDSKGYSFVNKLSLLPSEVRTQDNLEGGTVPTDKEEELMEQYQKQRADYEEKQLLKMAELKAQRSMGGGTSPQEARVEEVIPLGSAATPPGGASVPTDHTTKSGAVWTTGGDGYELVEPDERGVGAAKGARKIDPYEDPADAITGKVGVAKKTPPNVQRKLWSMGESGEAGQEYTPVFNTLPKGSTQQPAVSKPRRGSDSTSPTRPTKPLTSPHTYVNTPPSPPTGGKSSDSPPKPSTHSYENSPSVAHDSASGGSSPEHPGTGPAGGTTPPQASPMKQDETRVSKRKASKEVVEFDPNKQRKFRMSSSMKKSRKPGMADASGVEGDMKAAEVEETDSSGATANPEGAMPPAGKVVDLNEKGQELLSYAVVNMVDKKKFRLEADQSKVEGSGVPQHIRVPVATSS